MTLITRLTNEHNAVVQYAQESHHKDGFLDGMKKAIDIIKSHNSWIGADMPPDDNHDVWVSYKPIQKSHPNNKDRTRRYCMGYYSSVLQRWFVADADRFPSCICEVTHWQEIIPPNEEKGK